MDKDTPLSYLAKALLSLISPAPIEWQRDKRVQYVSFGIVIVFILIIVGGILLFNIGR